MRIGKECSASVGCVEKEASEVCSALGSGGGQMRRPAARHGGLDGKYSGCEVKPTAGDLVTTSASCEMGLREGKGWVIE